MNNSDINDKSVIIFDGVCNFCNGAVNFIIKRDHGQRFLFAPAQSEAGKALLEEHKLASEAAESVILIHGDCIHTRSDAAFEVLRGLKTAWKWMLMFRILPRPVRDAVYGYFAKNRYRFFGKMDSCIRPSPEIRARFLE